MVTGELFQIVEFLFGHQVWDGDPPAICALRNIIARFFTLAEAIYDREREHRRGVLSYRFLKQIEKHLGCCSVQADVAVLAEMLRHIIPKFVCFQVLGLSSHHLRRSNSESGRRTDSPCRQSDRLGRGDTHPRGPRHRYRQAIEFQHAPAVG